MKNHAKFSSANPLSNGTILLSTLALVLAFVWCFWPTIRELMRDWRNDENYSAGQIVPFVAAYVIWVNRNALMACPKNPSLLGVLLVAVGLGAWMLGLVQLLDSLQRYAMLIVVFGLLYLVAGGAVAWRLRGVMLFLLLMVPLPGRVHNWISGPLQSLATSGAVFCLELAGIAVSREGHTMVLNQSVPIAVAEACSGLRMLTAFVVVAATLAFLVPRPKWQRMALVLSSVPIAIACNLVRLVLTALLFLYLSGEAAERFFHDFAGWMMMPLAIVLLLLELWLFPKLVKLEPLPTSTLCRG